MDYVTEGKELLAQYNAGEIELSESQRQTLIDCLQEYSDSVNWVFRNGVVKRLEFFKTASDEDKDRLVALVALDKLRRGIRKPSAIDFEKAIEFTQAEVNEIDNPQPFDPTDFSQLNYQRYIRDTADPKKYANFTEADFKVQDEWLEEYRRRKGLPPSRVVIGEGTEIKIEPTIGFAVKFFGLLKPVHWLNPRLWQQYFYLMKMWRQNRSK